jgi:hypothetical protein
MSAGSTIPSAAPAAAAAAVVAAAAVPWHIYKTEPQMQQQYLNIQQLEQQQMLTARGYHLHGLVHRHLWTR